jgi:hypothetical protein
LRPAIALPDYALHAIRPAFQDGRQYSVGLPASNGIDRESANHSYHLKISFETSFKLSFKPDCRCDRGANVDPWCPRAGIANATDKEQITPSREGLSELKTWNKCGSGPTW